MRSRLEVNFFTTPLISLFHVVPQASTYDIPKKEKRQRRWRSKNNGKETKSTLQVHLKLFFFLQKILTNEFTFIQFFHQWEWNYSVLSSAFSVFVHQVPSCISSQSPRLHASNPNLSTTEPNTQEVCPESPDSPTEVSRLQEDFCRLANNSESLHECLLVR